MIELTIGDLIQVTNLAIALNPSDEVGEIEVPRVVGPDNNRRSVIVTGTGVKIDPNTPLLPPPPPPPEP